MSERLSRIQIESLLLLGAGAWLFYTLHGEPNRAQPPSSPQRASLLETNLIPIQETTLIQEHTNEEYIELIRRNWSELSPQDAFELLVTNPVSLKELYCNPDGSINQWFYEYLLELFDNPEQLRSITQKTGELQITLKSVDTYSSMSQNQLSYYTRNDLIVTISIDTEGSISVAHTLYYPRTNIDDATITSYLPQVLEQLFTDHQAVAITIQEITPEVPIILPETLLTTVFAYPIPQWYGLQIRSYDTEKDTVNLTLQFRGVDTAGETHLIILKKDIYLKAGFVHYPSIQLLGTIANENTQRYYTQFESDYMQQKREELFEEHMECF